MLSDLIVIYPFDILAHSSLHLQHANSLKKFLKYPIYFTKRYLITLKNSHYIGLSYRTAHNKFVAAL